MAKFFEALFDGSGDLTAYTPETGALTAPAANLDDTVAGTPYSQGAGNSALAAVIRDGSGAAQFNRTIETDEFFIFKLPDSPNPDYAIELVINTTPTADAVDILLCGRASGMFASPWDADAKNWTGAMAYFANSSDIGVYPRWASSGTTGDSAIVATGANYPAGPYNITIRLEFSGTTQILRIDGTVISTWTLTDPNFVSAVGSYVCMYFGTGAYTANLSNTKLVSLSAEAEPLPPATSVNFNSLRPRIFAPG